LSCIWHPVRAVIATSTVEEAADDVTGAAVMVAGEATDDVVGAAAVVEDALVLTATNWPSLFSQNLVGGRISIVGARNRGYQKEGFSILDVSFKATALLRNNNLGRGQPKQ
jgi:hypothetical protein